MAIDAQNRATIQDIVLRHRDKLTEFCRRWRIKEFALFGSVARGDVGTASDVDILVDFEPDAEWSLLDHIRMKQELETLLGRPVDLLTKRSVEYSKNWLLRQAILDSAQVLFSTSEETHAEGRRHAA